MSSCAPRFAATCLKTRYMVVSTPRPWFQRLRAQSRQGLEASEREVPKAISTEPSPFQKYETRPGLLPTGRRVPKDVITMTSHYQ